VIRALGFVSLGIDVSSEVIHALRPMFQVGTMAASSFVFGPVEGVTEAITALIRSVPARGLTSASPSQVCSR
jgi:hypothetical protein